MKTLHSIPPISISPIVIIVKMKDNLMSMTQIYTLN